MEIDLAFIPSVEISASLQEASEPKGLASGARDLAEGGAATQQKAVRVCLRNEAGGGRGGPPLMRDQQALKQSSRLRF